jgi:esterase/lipase superfamily enzyme
VGANALLQAHAVSVPSKRDGTRIYYPNAKPDPQRQYFITQRDTLTEETLVGAITKAPSFDGSVALFVHGYNNSFPEAVFRTAQMAADVKSGGPPILFSWPSAATVVGYVADRDAALYSRSELSRVIVLLAMSPRIKRIELVSHSMGAFLAMEVVRQLQLQAHTGAIGKLQIVLASPDIDIDVFRSQLRDIGNIPTPITLLVSKSDRALVVSSFLAGKRERVGKVDVSDPVIAEAARAERLRVVDISTLDSVDGLGHDRFATFARYADQLVQNETRNSTRLTRAGAFVFDAAGIAVATPFRIAGEIARP